MVERNLKLNSFFFGLRCVFSDFFLCLCVCVCVCVRACEHFAMQVHELDPLGTSSSTKIITA